MRFGLPVKFLFCKFLIVLFLLCGCSSSSVRNSTAEIEAKDLTAEFDLQLLKMFEERDAALDAHILPVIESVLTKLLKSNPQLAAKFPKKIEVQIVNTRKLIFLSGAKSSIILSTGLLANLRYESELASILSRELAILAWGGLSSRIGDQIPKVLLLKQEIDRPEGIFDLGVHFFLFADRTSAAIVHEAGYDPRGASSFLLRLNEHSKSLSFIQRRVLPSLKDRLEEVRDEIAKLSPLRDPIVSGPTFEEMRVWLGARNKKGKNDAGRTAIN